MAENSYDYRAVKGFALSSIFWGVIGLPIGILISLQLVYAQLNSHGEKFEGGISPALMGPKSLSVNMFADHVRVIADGTPNGMPGFQKQLGPDKVRAAAHYIHFHHTH